MRSASALAARVGSYFELLNLEFCAQLSIALSQLVMVLHGSLRMLKACA
jgi:hypothetical protein